MSSCPFWYNKSKNILTACTPPAGLKNYIYSSGYIYGGFFFKDGQTRPMLFTFSTKETG